MKIVEKLLMNQEELQRQGPITIVAFGDSITHGAVGENEIDYESVYWNRLKRKINAVRSYVPVNVINAGIGGTTAKRSLERMEMQVFSHHPDLVIVCFGLNDVNGSLDDYLGALQIIFQRCKKQQVDTIFMTPNMLNTYVAEDTAEHLVNYAGRTSEMQNRGRMDAYMQDAVKLAKDMEIEVCDCYRHWKKLSETQDITKLLANRINHPIREMHELFAQSLFEIIFYEMPSMINQNNQTMYQEEKE